MSQGTAQKLMLLIALFLPLLTYASEPVDTRQFGMISLGMSEAEVERRLGAPARIVEEPRTFVRKRPNSGRTELREKRRSTWVYPGGSHVMDTYITFEDEAVVAKEKRPR